MINGLSVRMSDSAIFSGMIIQSRVVKALLLREIVTRFGRKNLGFLWLLLEPVFFTVGVTILWNLLHSSAALRVEITPFIVTGYSCLLLWRGCSFRGLCAIEPNRALLHHRQVKIQDIFFARMLLEILGVTASFILVFVTMILIGLMTLPEDPLLLAMGWLFMSWFSGCLGIILGCLSELNDLVERFWHPTSYLLLSVSGTFYLVNWLPVGLQEVVGWVPMTHATEMIRAGYWGEHGTYHYSVEYVTGVCLSLTLISLALMANPRMKLLT